MGSYLCVNKHWHSYTCSCTSWWVSHLAHIDPNGRVTEHCITPPPTITSSPFSSPPPPPSAGVSVKYTGVGYYLVEKCAEDYSFEYLTSAVSLYCVLHFGSLNSILHCLPDNTATTVWLAPPPPPPPHVCVHIHCTWDFWIKVVLLVFQTSVTLAQMHIPLCAYLKHRLLATVITCMIHVWYTLHMYMYGTLYMYMCIANWMECIVQLCNVFKG